MLSPRLMPHPRLTLPLMPGMAITVIPVTTADTAVATTDMVDMPADTTDTVATTDTPMAVTVTSARGPLMLNPRPMLMLPLMPGMATTDTPMAVTVTSARGP